MQTTDNPHIEPHIEELVRKYKWAGKIRFIIFSLLLLFLILMKYLGGYSYLNNAFICLILVEAVLNQPYKFLLQNTNIYRFQYYQMITDIIAISWIIYYMGGVEAPIVSLAYYAVILWAGVVSSTAAVFFAVISASLLFSSIVLLSYFGILPYLGFSPTKMPFAQMASLLLANVCFLFAFGYFSAHSSRIIKFLQRKKQEESLRNAHKILATGSLVGRTAHDILNQFACIKGYTEVLLEKDLSPELKDMFASMRDLAQKGADSLKRLAMFSKEGEREFEVVDIHKVIESALKVTWPLVRYSKMEVEKKFAQDLPKIIADARQLQETFVVFILNSLDAIEGDKGTLSIATQYDRENAGVEITFCDTGTGIRPQDLAHIGEPFFTTKGAGKGLGIGLATAYGIIQRHNGSIKVESQLNQGTVFTVRLPVRQTRQKPQPLIS